MSGDDDLPPFQRHSDTSRQAALEAILSTNTQRARVLRLLRRRRDHQGLGLTDEQMQQQLNMNPSTQRPRRIELVDRGLVEDSQLRRKTMSGRNAVIWRAT